MWLYSSDTRFFWHFLEEKLWIKRRKTLEELKFFHVGSQKRVCAKIVLEEFPIFKY
jgi:hypothetical protein